MYPRLTLSVLILAGTTLVLASSTSTAAQAIYYRSIPIGERAIGLGGSFTGVADDPSATYYNPAGLVRGGRFSLLGSFSSVVFIRRKIDNAFEAPLGEQTFNSKNTTTLPRFVGTVVKFGRKKFGNDHQFAIGYSTVEVARDKFNVGVTQEDSASDLDLRVDDSFNSRWYGISFAAEVTERDAVGFTIFLADQRVRYTENIGLAAGGSFDPDTEIRTGGESVTSSGQVGASAYYFVPTLGWLHRINEKWTVGVLFQTPGIPLKQKGNIVRNVTMAAPGTDSTFFLFNDDSLKSNLPIPFELRTGFGFQVKPDTLVAFDAAITGPIKDKPLLGPASALGPINGVLGVYLPSSVERRWTPNVSIGAEHEFGKAVVSGGLFTNVSAAPKVPATSSVDVPTQINLWGASVAIGLDTNGYRLTVGANGLFGKGKALSAVVDQQANVVTYQRTGATSGALILYIAGAISIATKTAEKVKEKRKSDEENTSDTEAEKAPESAAPTETSTP